VPVGRILKVTDHWTALEAKFDVYKLPCWWCSFYYILHES